MLRPYKKTAVTVTAVGESTYDGCGTIAENHGGERNCVATQRGGDHCGGAGYAQRKSCGGAGNEGRPGTRRDLRGWQAAEKPGAAAVLCAEQTKRLRDNGQRSGGAADSYGVDKKLSGARVSGGAAGL